MSTINCLCMPYIHEECNNMKKNCKTTTINIQIEYFFFCIVLHPFVGHLENSSIFQLRTIRLACIYILIHVYCNTVYYIHRTAHRLYNYCIFGRLMPIINSEVQYFLIELTSANKQQALYMFIYQLNNVLWINWHEQFSSIQINTINNQLCKIKSWAWNKTKKEWYTVLLYVYYYIFLQYWRIQNNCTLRFPLIILHARCMHFVCCQLHLRTGCAMLAHIDVNMGYAFCFSA